MASDELHKIFGEVPPDLLIVPLVGDGDQFIKCVCLLPHDKKEMSFCVDLKILVTQSISYYPRRHTTSGRCTWLYAQIASEARERSTCIHDHIAIRCRNAASGRLKSTKASDAE
jgi:hypothetical protein